MPDLPTLPTSDLLAKTREICRLFEINPARSKGQNFLINEKIYDDIVKAADLKPTETVLEVGPGLGFLTAKLATRVKKVIAVELDDKLANYLQMAVDAQGVENVTVVNKDILKVPLESFLGSSEVKIGGQTKIGDKTKAEPYKIVANLPYNITSLFLRRFLSTEPRPEFLVLMLQKEVAERIIATPPDMSILAVSVQYYGEPKIIRTVKAGNFWPEPSVDSAIIKIELRPDHFLAEPGGAAEADKKFFQMVRIGFSAKRKMLKNNLAAGLKSSPKNMENILVKQGFNPKVRAEDLSLQDWRKLFAALKPFVI